MIFFFAIDDFRLKAIPVIVNKDNTAIKRLDTNKIIRRLNNYFNSDELTLISRLLDVEIFKVYKLIALNYGDHRSVLLDEYIKYLKKLILNGEKYKSKTISLNSVLKIQKIIEKELSREVDEQRRIKIRDQHIEERLIARQNKKEKAQEEKANKIAELHNQTTDF